MAEASHAVQSSSASCPSSWFVSGLVRYFPAPQSVHTVEPVSFAYLPAPQMVQALAANPAVAEYLPTTQSVHSELPAIEYLPAAQSVHTESPATANLPAGHSEHSPSSSAPGALVTSPSGHACCKPPAHRPSVPEKHPRRRSALKRGPLLFQGTACKSKLTVHVNPVASAGSKPPK